MKVPRPAYYRKFQRIPLKFTNWVVEETMNRGDQTGDGARLYDYYKMGKIIKNLPTTMEKINFVNPYQRNWMTTEKKWHRAWMPDLIEPRKSWNVPSLPQYYDTLNFYKYITKSRITNGIDAKVLMDKYYTSDSLPILDYKKRLTELALLYLNPEKEETSEETNLNKKRFLRQFIEEAYQSLAHLELNYRISHSSRCESFWIRSGFDKMYQKQDIWDDKITLDWKRFVTDDERLTGEFSFNLRDNFVSNIRTLEPLKNIFEFSDVEQLEAPMFTEEINLNEEVIFNPKIYNLSLDSDILWQCPGYDADSNETYKFGQVAVKDTSDSKKLIDYWKPESEEERMQMDLELIDSTAVASMFSWLNAQAHCLGHTQYTDIKRPLTSQLILTDGYTYNFVLGQLNTIAINMDVEGFVNNKTNLCIVDGPYKLFKNNDSNELNEDVIQRILQTICV